jgi:DnaJ-class molecular chaperone
MVEYRESCRTCEGVGTVAIESTLTSPEGGPEIKPCGECDGLGAILTQEGQSLIQFLEQVDPQVLGRRVPDGGFG